MRISKLLLLFIFTCANFLHSTQEVFEETYKTKITKCFGSVWEPSYYRDYWTANIFICFENGLYAVNKLPCYSESEAKRVSQYQYEGTVNIVYDSSFSFGDFSIVYEDGSYPTHHVDLWFSTTCKIGRFPRITSITETVETISHWFYTEYKYAYVITLNDGSSWLTKSRSSPWTIPWEIGSKVLIIGNSRHPCFINVEAVLEEELSKIKANHYLNDLELLQIDEMQKTAAYIEEEEEFSCQ